MSSVRSRPASTSGLPIIVWVATLLWVVVGGAATLVSLRSSTGTAGILMTIAAVVAFGSLVVGGFLWARSGSPGWWAGALLVSALAAPTTFAYPLNMIPAFTSLGFIVWAHRQGRAGSTSHPVNAVG